MSIACKSKKPKTEPEDSMLITFGKVLYGDRAWQKGLADFFNVHVNTVDGWVYGRNNCKPPPNRYADLNTEVIRRQLVGDLPK